METTKPLHQRGGLSLFAVVLLLIGLNTATRPAFAAFPISAVATEFQRHVAYKQELSTLNFERNVGQTEQSIDFLCRGRGCTLFLSPQEATIALQQYQTRLKDAPKQAVLQMKIAGANPLSHGYGERQLPGKINYLTSPDRKTWHIGVPIYAEVRYRQVYPGIDLLYHGNFKQLEYDFQVNPGADPKAIRLQFTGEQTISIARSGDLVLRVGLGRVQWHRPTIYQIIHKNKKIISGGYRIFPDHSVTFTVGKYDHSTPLIIDPILAYATYIGANALNYVDEIAVDHNGNAYLAGSASAPVFPNTPGIYSLSVSGDFVTKLNSTGSQLIYSTYLGSWITCSAIAVDDDGHAYIAGNATMYAVSSGMPRSNVSSTAAYIAELSDDGSQILNPWFITGNKQISIAGLALDPENNAYIAGSTDCTDFPVTANAFQKSPRPKASDARDLWPATDAFVAKVNLKRSGTDSLIYSTLLGGSKSTHIYGIAVTSTGEAIVAGATSATDFPTTPNAYQTTFIAKKPTFYVSPTGQQSGFLTELDAEGKSLRYSSYIGGEAIDSLQHVATNTTGLLYFEGQSYSGLPTTADALYPIIDNNWEKAAFVGCIDPKKSGNASMDYLTYVNSKGLLDAQIAVDNAGDLYITGNTVRSDYPTSDDAIQRDIDPGSAGASTLFLSILNPAGSKFLWSSYLGEGGDTEPYGIALDQFGSAYIAGVTTYNIMPMSPSSYLPFAPDGVSGGFALKVSGYTPSGPSISNLRPYPVFSGNSDQTLTINGSGFVDGARISFNNSTAARANFISSRKLMVTIPDALTASAQPILVTVYNPPDGQSYSAILPVIDPEPAIAFVTPLPLIARRNSGSVVFVNGTLMVFGTGFTPLSVVSCNGSAPEKIGYEMPIKCSINIPAAQMAYPGPLDIAITNPAPRHGTAHILVQISAQDTPPVLTGLGITHVRAGSPEMNLFVTGHHLQTVKKVYLNSLTVQNQGSGYGYNFEDFNVTIPADMLAQPGTIKITADNSEAGGGLSNTLTLTVEP